MVSLTNCVSTGRIQINVPPTFNFWLLRANLLNLKEGIVSWEIDSTLVFNVTAIFIIHSRHHEQNQDANREIVAVAIVKAFYGV